MDCPELTSLELDNCNGTCQSSRTLGAGGIAGLAGGSMAADEGPFTYGNYLERFFDAFTGGPGSEMLRLPSLEALDLWHNHNAMGPPHVNLSRMVDVQSKAGHPRLKSLRCWNLSHFRRLALRGMPRLRSVSVSDQQAVPTLEEVEVDLSYLLGRRVSIMSGNKYFQ